MIDNKKYLKDVSSMYSTAQRVKKYVVAELDKIDEKYRKIIAEEKKKLNEQLEVLNAQIKFYASIVNPEETPAEEKAEEAPAEEQKEEVEEKIQDTIFPENNEPDEEEKKEAEDEEIAEDLNDAIQQEKGEMEEENPVKETQRQNENAEQAAPRDLDAEEDAEWDQRIESGELKEVPFEQSDTQQQGDPNQWPEYEEKKEVAVQETADDWSDVDQWQ